jgi:hypothetical protein
MSNAQLIVAALGCFVLVGTAACDGADPSEPVASQSAAETTGNGNCDPTCAAIGAQAGVTLNCRPMRCDYVVHRYDTTWACLALNVTNGLSGADTVWHRWVSGNVDPRYCMTTFRDADGGDVSCPIGEEDAAHEGTYPVCGGDRRD